MEVYGGIVEDLYHTVEESIAIEISTQREQS